MNITTIFSMPCHYHSQLLRKIVRRRSFSLLTSFGSSTDGGNCHLSFQRRDYSNTSSAATPANLSNTSSSPVILHYDWVTEPLTSNKAKTANERQQSQQQQQQQHQQQHHLVVALHGLLGNGKNVRTLTKTYCQALQQQQQQQQQSSSASPHTTTTSTTIYHGVTMDLRGHGHSASGTLPPTMQACAQDVHATLQHLLMQQRQQQQQQQESSPTWSMTLLGHSWGGRVALQYTYDFYYHNISNNSKMEGQQAQQLPSLVAPTLSETWVLDSAPGVINDDVRHVLDVVQELEQGHFHDHDDVTTFKTASPWAKYLMEHYHFSNSLAQWLASSIRYKETSTSDGSVKFVFDTRVALGLVPEFAKQDVLGMVQEMMNHQASSTTTTVLLPQVHLVRAGNSDSWTPDVLQRLDQILSNKQTSANSNVHLHVLPNTGHWLHVEDLNGLVELMIQNKKTGA